MSIQQYTHFHSQRTLTLHSQSFFFLVKRVHLKFIQNSRKFCTNFVQISHTCTAPQANLQCYKSTSQCVLIKFGSFSITANFFGNNRETTFDKLVNFAGGANCCKLEGPCSCMNFLLHPITMLLICL